MPSPPVFAYLILSHGEPSQAVRLIRRIRADRPASIVVSHHDPSTSIFPSELFAGDDNVLFVKPSIRGAWGEISVLHMVLGAIDTLYSSGKRFDWVTLLSGQDYPIKPLATFENAAGEFFDGALHCEPGSPRVDRVSFVWRRVPRILESRYTRALFARLQALNAMQPWIHFVSGRLGCRYGIRRFRSPLPGAMVFRKGSAWWTLSEPCVSAVQAVRRDHPEVLESYRRALIPDESFFQTILYSDRRFKLVNDDLRFIRWDDPANESPATLSLADLPALRSSPAFFARKFRADVDEELVTAIDRMLADRVAGGAFVPRDLR